jgi:hypothetical protein
MACERRVLCSNVTSLSEVAGDGVSLFDAHGASAVVDAIQRLASEPDLEAALVDRGCQRMANFGTRRDVAAKHLAAVEAVAARSGAYVMRAPNGAECQLAQSPSAAVSRLAS